MTDEMIVKKIYSKKTIEKTMNKIKKLGIYNKLDGYKFLKSRFISSILLFFIVLFLFNNGYIYAPIITLVYYNLIYYISIDYKLKIREKQLEYEALQFFEVLALCIETGRDLRGSIEITANNIEGELSEEFKQVIKEVEMSKSLNEALKSLQQRIPSDSINNIILNISETTIFGGRIIETMYNQIDFLNDKKIQNVRGEIAKLPMKHSIISTLFFIPLILLLILGPVIINIYNDYVISEKS